MTALEEIKKALEGVTPGPWHVAETGLGNKLKAPTVYHAGEDLNYVASFADFMTFKGPARNLENARYIAAVNPAVITELLSTLESLQRDNEETLETYYERQIEWSRQTFGPALRTKGIIDHIKKELVEIEADPHDLSEWVDVVILAMDGFWRHGGNADDLFKALIAKQQKNMARTWPDWRTMREDTAIEHDRSKDALASTGGEHNAE